MPDNAIPALVFLESEPQKPHVRELDLSSADLLRESLGNQAPAVLVVAEPWLEVLRGHAGVLVHEPATHNHWGRVLGKLEEAQRSAGQSVKAVLKRDVRKEVGNFRRTIEAIFREAKDRKLERAMVILALEHDQLSDLAERSRVRIRQSISHADVERWVPLESGSIPDVIAAAFPGRSPVASLVRALATKAVASPSVLLRGPSGAGKRVLAQAIHAAGRGARPFETVRCGAFIDDRDLERALFGQGEGVGAQIGAWERARGGTLLLQEVADLSAPMQKKVAAALRDGRWQRAGAPHLTVTLEDGPRVIATTSEPLESIEGAGEFDEELLLRLLSMSIRVPALTERVEDMEEIVGAVWRRAGGQAPLSSEVREALKRRLWRGNLRGLKSFLTTLVRRHGGRVALEEVQALLEEMEPISQAWGMEVRLPPPAACVRFLTAVAALLSDCRGRLAGLDQRSGTDELVKTVMLAVEEPQRRLKDMLAEPFSFADQGAWRRARAAWELLVEMGDCTPGEALECWREKRGARLFAEAEGATEETIAWLKTLH
jgi:DNA-binding NtrC family response regulator